MKNPIPFGPIMIDVEGINLTAYDREKLSHPNTGALILFSRNYEHPKQITELIIAIRSARKGPLLIAVDQEGGRVQRFKEGFTRLPPACRYKKHPGLAEQAGWLMAAELLSVGVDLSFAPVLDIDCGISEVIGDRSFSEDSTLATQLAGAFRSGMNRAGMAAVGKHFPGHGAVAADSHLALPVDERDFSEIWEKDIQPFKKLIADGLEGIMPAHVVYPAVDDKPAGFSVKWIQQILRQELQFNGTVFSDDLSMEGAAFAGSFSDRAFLAQEAGCDMILVCNNPKGAEEVLDALPIKTDPLREHRLKGMLGKPQMNAETLKASNEWQTISQQINRMPHESA